MRTGEVWHGRTATPYEGVSATIDDVTTRNVILSYDRVVDVNGVQTIGEVMTQKKFNRMFEQIVYEQGELF
ncbi:hypothetical protein IC620_16205 [Hazenella sp. IB182357]|uniref:Uncharacterized protein n=1 Tax=Polycladospora coralii TaxID=2771432 RepID=A0A926RV75_9BACL|nr:hypothetical protein [Polycladospora coralii]MBD1373888.1 hypothetical protein [Polycladospora coralii]